MKLFRYRKPSLNTILGITNAKKRFRKTIGISTFEKYTKPSRIKQRIKQRLGLYSPVMRVIRQTSKGNFPTFLGLFKGKS